LRTHPCTSTRSRYAAGLLLPPLVVLTVLLSGAGVGPTATPLVAARATPTRPGVSASGGFFLDLASPLRLDGPARWPGRVGLEGRIALPRLVLALSLSPPSPWSSPVDQAKQTWANLGALKTPDGILLARLAYGLYFGKVESTHGQLFVSYDREHLRPAERGRGKIPGGIGLEGTLYLRPQVGLHLETKVGRGGWFGGLSLVWRP